MGIAHRWPLAGGTDGGGPGGLHVLSGHPGRWLSPRQCSVVVVCGTVVDVVEVVEVLDVDVDEVDVVDEVVVTTAPAVQVKPVDVAVKVTVWSQYRCTTPWPSAHAHPESQVFDDPPVRSADGPG